MHRSSALGALQILGLLLFASSCSSVFIEQRVGQFDMAGEVLTGFGGSQGTNSFDALGIGDENLEALPSVTFETKPSIVILDYLSRDTVGIGVLEQEVALSDLTLPAGTTVQSEQELTFARLRYLHDLASSDSVDLAIGLGVGWVAVDITIDGSLDRGDFDESAPFPLLTAQAAWRTGSLEFELDGSLTDFDIEDVEASYTSLMGSVRWSFLDSPTRAALTLGYRVDELDLGIETSDDETIDYQADLDGAFLGLQFAF